MWTSRLGRHLGPVALRVFRRSAQRREAGAAGEAGLVEPWATPVRNENGWREAMARYNVHYAVRRVGLPQERFKPFTKGMLAARVGAVAVVSTLDAEAMRLLGEDYPFAVAPGRGLPAMLRFVEEMREGFGDARWQLARRA